MTYWPGPAPQSPIGAYVRAELEKIATELRQLPQLQLKELAVEPDKPRAGMVVCANGTDWDPGSGAGFYGYSGGAWVFLG